MSTVTHKPYRVIAITFVLLAGVVFFSVDVFAVENAVVEKIPINAEKTAEPTTELSAGLSADISVENFFEKPLEKNSGKVSSLTSNGLSDSSMAGNLVQTTLGLLLVLLVIGAAAWAFKRFGNVHVGAQGRMKIIGGISLGARERAVLLQVGEQQLVIGVSPGRVQTLHVLDKPVLIENRPEKTNGFSSRLQSAILARKSNVNKSEIS